MFGRPCPAAGIPSAFSAADDEAVLDRERRQVRHAAGSRMAVLLNGKGGTDKATTAHRRHGLSPQSESAFLQVNCCAFSQRLIECELYGHGQGAGRAGGSKARSGRDRPRRYPVPGQGRRTVKDTEIRADPSYRLIVSALELAPCGRTGRTPWR